MSNSALNQEDGGKEKKTVKIAVGLVCVFR